MEYDGHSRTKVFLASAMFDITGDVKTLGNVIDTAGFESLEFAFFTGSPVPGSHSIELDESDTGAFAGEENVVAADDLIGTSTPLTAIDDITRIGYGGKKQFCRLNVVSTGISGGPIPTLAAIAILGRPRSMPVADQ